MPRRKQARRMTVQDIRTILRLTHDRGLCVREIALRLKLSKTTVSTYLLRAREAGLNCWPLPAGRDDDTTLKQALFQRVGRPPRDLTEPDWPRVSAEMKVVPREMVYELASTCFFIAGVSRSLGGDHRGRVGIITHGRHLFHRHVAA